MKFSNEFFPLRDLLQGKKKKKKKMENKIFRKIKLFYFEDGNIPRDSK